MLRASETSRLHSSGRSIGRARFGPHLMKTHKGHMAHGLLGWQGRRGCPRRGASIMGSMTAGIIWTLPPFPISCRPTHLESMMAEYLAASSASSRLGHHWKKNESEAPLKLRFMAKRHLCVANILVNSRIISLAWMVAFPLLYTAWNGIWKGENEQSSSCQKGHLLESPLRYDSYYIMITWFQGVSLSLKDMTTLTLRSSLASISLLLIPGDHVRWMVWKGEKEARFYNSRFTLISTRQSRFRLPHHDRGHEVFQKKKIKKAVHLKMQPPLHPSTLCLLPGF